MMKNRALTPNRINRSGDGIAAHLLGLEQLAAVLEVEGYAGGEELCQCLQEVHIQVGTLQRVQSGSEHIHADDLPPALSQDLIPFTHTVPHLAAGKGVKQILRDFGAGGDHQLHRSRAILEGGHVVQSGKACHLLIMAEAVQPSAVLLQNPQHGIPVRELCGLPEKHLDQERPAGAGRFLAEILLIYLIHFRFLLLMLWGLSNRYWVYRA